MKRKIQWVKDPVEQIVKPKNNGSCGTFCQGKKDPCATYCVIDCEDFLW